MAIRPYDDTPLHPWRHAEEAKHKEWKTPHVPCAPAFLNPATPGGCRARCTRNSQPSLRGLPIGSETRAPVRLSLAQNLPIAVHEHRRVFQ